ncbi:MAG: YihY/virulence factor BrkB family protein [Armatimonadetes bacterium]|nr:YihY/virulence factor BrkB family protein [Armatimonadota bacterium]
MNGIVEFLKQTIRAWGSDNCPRMAAALSFYALFSLAPMLLLIASAAAQFYGEHSARLELFNASKRLLGPSSAKALGDLMAASQNGSSASNILGTLVLIVAASGAFAQLVEALNLIFHGEEPVATGIVAHLKVRLIGVLVVLAVGVLVIALTLVSAWITLAIRVSGEYLPANLPLLFVADTLLTLVSVTAVFSMMYRWIPTRRPIRWRNALGGALFASVLFSIVKILFSYYIGTFNPASVFGAAGSLVVALLFVYLSAYTLLFGAEAAKSLQSRTDLKPVP